METYPLDISADQAVRWLMAEARSGRTPGALTCTQSFLVEDIPPTPELHLGDVERDDLSEVTAVGVLELHPQHASEGWVFQIRVEDALNLRLMQDAPVGDRGDLGEVQNLDLQRFHETFIAPGRGVAYVNVEAEDEAARLRFDPLLEDMQTNRHRG